MFLPPVHTEKINRSQTHRCEQSASKHDNASSAVTRSDSESIFQHFPGEYHGNDSCYLIYFDSSTIVRLSGLL